MKNISLLGGTGSVGASTCDILRRFPQTFRLQAVSAYSNVKKLVQIVEEFEPALTAIGNEAFYKQAKEMLAGKPTRLVCGREGLEEVATLPTDCLVSAIVGLAGLEPTLEALKLGRTVALANKECLVAAGPLFLSILKESKAKLLPLDSEHSALFQLMGGHAFLNAPMLKACRKLILTASGGPLWSLSRKAMAHVRPEQACAHPIWSMGAKISIDSATMVNKALELAEAFYLFNVPVDCIDTLIHPQALVHAWVTFSDGTTHMSASIPDMRIPIAQALFWPEKPCITSDYFDIDLPEPMTLDFFPPDDERFLSLPLMRALLKENNPLLLTIFNAANEMAVSLYLQGHIGFLDIVTHIQYSLDKMGGSQTSFDLETIYTTDKFVREDVYRRCLSKRASTIA